MAVVKIKYSEINDQPVTLLEGELAFSNTSEKLFIGTDKGTVVKEVSTGGSSTEDYVEQVVDYISDTVLYRAEAQTVGALTSAAVWRIREITINATATSATTKYADGSELFDKVWDDRASYTYS